GAPAALRGVRRLAPRAATPAELELVHSAAHVERMRALSVAGGGAVDPDTYATPRTFEVARHAVGALLAAVDEIAAGRARNAFCAGRPPGHPASRDRAVGSRPLSPAAGPARAVPARTPRDTVRTADVH